MCILQTRAYIYLSYSVKYTVNNLNITQSESKLECWLISCFLYHTHTRIIIHKLIGIYCNSNVLIKWCYNTMLICIKCHLITVYYEFLFHLFSVINFRCSVLRLATFKVRDQLITEPKYKARVRDECAYINWCKSGVCRNAHKYEV